MKAAFRLFSRQMFVLLAICLVGILVTPVRDYFKGFAIGLIISFYCMWLLGRKVEKVTSQRGNGGMSFISLGMLSRVAMAILGALAMYQLGHELIIWTLAVGILGGYFLMIADCAYINQKGEKWEVS